jgi:ferric-dicitrate binding protein FerR (iron transport regulator)
MDIQDIHIIITKFFSHEASEQEVQQLDEWLKDASNQKEFKRLERLWFGAEQLNDFAKRKDLAKQRFRTFVREERKTVKVRKLQLNVFKYAAIFIGLIIGAYFIYLFTPEMEELPQIAEYTEMEAPTQDQVFIKTESGEIVVLNAEEAKELRASDGTLIQKDSGEQVAYHSKIDDNVKTVMHELGVPRGKRMDLVLADGTKVWLNSESVIRYPTQFHGKQRVVVLEGEAYFEVAKDRNKPFIVKTSDLNVRVLGTSFNLSSYKTGKSIDLTLVEGKVGMYKKETKFNPKKAVLVVPNQRASYNKEEKQMNLDDCDPDIYCSWIKGKLQFRNESFKNLKIKLERWYDVDIVNENLTLENIAFSGDFDNEDIQQVMETISRNTGIKYKINNRKIIIMNQ